MLQHEACYDIDNCTRQSLLLLARLMVTGSADFCMTTVTVWQLSYDQWSTVEMHVEAQKQV